MYVTTCQISSSVIPTPIPPAVAGGMAVPAIPSWMLWNISSSELPCRFCARVKSGPRPPPRAPNPWQNAQFDRNCDSPSFATFASPAYGFFVCASEIIPAQSAAIAHTITRNPIRHPFFFWNFILAGTSRIFCANYTTQPAATQLNSVYRQQLLFLPRSFVTSLLLNLVLKLIRVFSIRRNDNFHLPRQSGELSRPRIRHNIDRQILRTSRHRPHMPQRERSFLSRKRAIHNFHRNVHTGIFPFAHGRQHLSRSRCFQVPVINLVQRIPRDRLFVLVRGIHRRHLHFERPLCHHHLRSLFLLHIFIRIRTRPHHHRQHRAANHGYDCAPLSHRFFPRLICLTTNYQFFNFAGASEYFPGPPTKIAKEISNCVRAYSYPPLPISKPCGRCTR